jgi:hydroxymethylglutaryl-CoA reductase
VARYGLAEPVVHFYSGPPMHFLSGVDTLSPTGGALVKCAGLDEAVMLAGTHRADETRWPAPAHHRLPALSLCSVKDGKLRLTKALLKLHLVARHRSNPQKQPHVPVMYQTVARLYQLKTVIAGIISVFVRF